MIDWLIGEYDNIKQAQSQPTKYSHVQLTYDLTEDGFIHVVQKYVHDGRIYRERYHDLVQFSDTEVLVRNYLKDWTRNENCDMLCTFDSKLEVWVGKGSPLCTCRGAQVESHFRLTEDTIECYDYGEKDGEHIFGGRNPYFFVKKTLHK